MKIASRVKDKCLYHYLIHDTLTQMDMTFMIYQIVHVNDDNNYSEMVKNPSELHVVD